MQEKRTVCRVWVGAECDLACDPGLVGVQIEIEGDAVDDKAERRVIGQINCLGGNVAHIFSFILEQNVQMQS